MSKYKIIAIIVIFIAIGVIITTISSISNYSDFKSARTEKNIEHQILGKLIKHDSVKLNTDKNGVYLDFYMQDNKNNIEKVVYYGAKPFDFEKSEQLVIKGKFADTAFIATNLLLKCPSKYERKADLKSMKKDSVIEYK